jgi:hypothetical protein
MKINYVSVKKTDKIVDIDPLEISVTISLSKVKEYYLTPLQAILLGIMQKYGKNYEWVSIPDSINGCFMHFEGGRDIDSALNSLIEKRLIVEGDLIFPFESECRVFRLNEN